MTGARVCKAHTDSVKEEAVKRGYELKFVDGQGKQENQIQGVSSLILQGVDAIKDQPGIEIAAVVIGGTQLSGGVGFVTGTLLGVLVYATIELAITFDGNLSSSVTSIAIGVLLLLLLFIVLQRLMSRSGQK